MKIAKYIFLLLLLSVGTISVFVATKDGSYQIQRKKIIDVSKDIAYKYVAEDKNWDSINPWKADNWKISEIQKLNDSTITHNITINEVNHELTLTFKDTLSKKTVLTWSTKGQMDFKEKFLGLINRGTDNNFAKKFDDGLLAINNILTREINTYTIKVDGFVKRDTVFYIQRPVSCKIEEIPSKINYFLPKLNELLKITNTPSNGVPFLIYHSKDSIKNKYTFSIAVPTKKKIYTSAESDIYNGQTDPFGAIKATLTGNYNHKKEALAKIKTFIEENHLEQSDTYKEIELIPKNITTDKSASKWVTEIYIPVRPKKIVPIKPKVAAKDSLKPMDEFQ